MSWKESKNWTEAEQIFAEERMPFQFSNEADGIEETVQIDLTTAQAVAVRDMLATMGTVVVIEPKHPKFLGWSEDEICNKLDRREE